MRSLPRITGWVVFLSVLGAGALYWQATRDRMVMLTPGIHLAWDGRRWSLLDGRHAPDLLGGYVVAGDLAGVGHYPGAAVFGREAAGRLFILPLGKADDRDAKWFASEPEWLAACRAAGIASPTLSPPADAAGR